MARCVALKTSKLLVADLDVPQKLYIISADKDNELHVGLTHFRHVLDILTRVISVFQPYFIRFTAQ